MINTESNELFFKVQNEDRNAFEVLFKKLYPRLKDLVDNNILPEKNGANYEYGRATKAAAQVLLAKLYMNKMQFIEGADGDWAAAKVLMDDIITKSQYDIDADYFHIFSIHNEDSPEVIFCIPYDSSPTGTSISNRASLTFAIFPIHYNQSFNPIYNGGTNGACTTPSFLERLQANGDTTLDIRYKDTTTRSLLNGMTIGFLSGQQYNGEGDSIMIRGDRGTLYYSLNVHLTVAKENEGIRVLKYAPDPTVPAGNQGNDFLIYRYSDVLLMLAECAFRLDNASSVAKDDVNQLRVLRNLGELSSLTLEDIFNERRRELYLEGLARQDYIRFGKYTEPHYNKPDADPAGRSTMFFKVPRVAMDRNPNLVQN
jgi:hypothetical protein